ncbi:MAG: M23 family metallopeptidase [Cyanobacteriota bacterium]|nr:M23 family metallopeptidase [Cyanobacteriota bacterium]
MKLTKGLSPEKQWEIEQTERDRYRRGDILAAIVCFLVLAIVAVPRFNSWADAAIAWAWMGTPGFRFPQLPQGEERALKRGDMVSVYEVSAPFLPCEDPAKSTEDCRTWEGRPRAHYGVDVALPIGTPLYIPSDGRAIEAEITCSSSSVGGNAALIELSGSKFSFRALHLDKCMPGTKRAGEIYALSGNTGYSTGPHLHWEEYRDEALQDPSFRYLEQTIVGAIE